MNKLEIYCALVIIMEALTLIATRMMIAKPAHSPGTDLLSFLGYFSLLIFGIFFLATNLLERKRFKSSRINRFPE